MKPSFFNAAADFRLWLEVHHTTHTELVVGFYKRDSGKGGPLPTGRRWMKRCASAGLMVCAKALMPPVTPSVSRRASPRSIWSRVNLRHIERLQKSGRVMPAGLKKFQARNPAKCGIYAFENAARTLTPADERNFKADKKAWAYFQQQAPWYRRTAIWWIVSAKKEETRARRFAQLLKDSAASRRLAHLARTRSGADSPGV